MIYLECKRGLAKRIHCNTCKKDIWDRDYGVAKQIWLSGGGYKRWFNDACNSCHRRADRSLQRAKKAAYYQSDAVQDVRKSKNVIRTRAREDKVQKATPPWVDMDEIKEIYMKAYENTRKTGIPHEVDHIIPIRHKAVCGLHVPANLRVIPASENRSKSNKCEADEWLNTIIYIS